MAQVLFSGCDVLSNVGGIAGAIASTVYAGTNQNGSTGPPGGTTMSFVGKYADVIGATEFNQLRAAGLSVFFFMENSSLQHNSGAATYSVGVSDATAAKNNLTTLGIWPLPVYFAIDYDASTNDAVLWARYFEGATDTIGAANMGLYGSVGVWADIQLQMNTDSYVGPTYFCQSRSYGWRDNGNYFSGQHLWQWPPAYSPGGNLVISGTGVDGEFAYASDFGQYPRPNTPPGGGGGGTGVVTFGQQSNGTIVTIAATFTQPEIQNIVTPRDTHDEVIYSNTFTDSITNAVGSYTIGPVVKVPQQALPLGNFSFDNGSTWNDFGFIFSGDFGAFPGSLPAVVIQAEVDSSGNLSFNAAVNQVVGTAGTIDLIIHVALLYGPLISGTKIIDLPQVTQRLGYGTSINPANLNTLYVNGNSYTPLANYSSYRRISSDSSVNVGSATVAHGLGAIPNLVFWGFDGSSILTQPVVWASDGAVAAHLGIAMDSTNLYFNVDNSLQSVFYRTYRDN